MKFLILLASVSLASTSSILYNGDGRCSDIVISGANQEMVVVKNDLDAPYQMAIDYNTNFLFFSYTGAGNNIMPAYIDLNTNEFGTIYGIRGGFANAFDETTNEVLIGAMDGIYKFDYETKTGVKTNITTENIWQLFVQDDIYFTTFPQEQAFVYTNGEVKKVAGIGDSNVMQISVDTENNIFFYNSSGLYCHQNATGDTIYLGNIVVVGFTKDINGELYFSTPTGLYKILKSLAIEKIARIMNVYGLVIAGDGNIIYAASDSIIKLKPTGTQCIPELTIFAD